MGCNLPLNQRRLTQPTLVDYVALANGLDLQLI